jgi:hypothetical protein
MEKMNSAAGCLISYLPLSAFLEFQFVNLIFRVLPEK